MVSEEKTAPTVRIDIYMAGDITQAKQVCREVCMEVGLCVHVEPVDFIYTGGEERGFKVGLINYPRFPIAETRRFAIRARVLAEKIRERCCQHSYSIIGPESTLWVSHRPAPESLNLPSPDKGEPG